MEKHSVSRLSYLFAHLHLLSSDSFSSTLLSSNLSLLSDPFHLRFSSVGSLISKLPSIIFLFFLNAGGHRSPGGVGDQRRHLPGTRETYLQDCGGAPGRIEVAAGSGLGF